MKKSIMILGFGLVTMFGKAQFLNDGNYSFSDEPNGGPGYLTLIVENKGMNIKGVNLSSGPKEYIINGKGKWVASQTKNEVLEKKKANGKYQINSGKGVYKIEYNSDKTIRVYENKNSPYKMYKQK
jgi:hypothetical protein